MKTSKSELKYIEMKRYINGCIMAVYGIRWYTEYVGNPIWNYLNMCLAFLCMPFGLAWTLWDRWPFVHCDRWLLCHAVQLWVFTLAVKVWWRWGKARSWHVVWHVWLVAMRNMRILVVLHVAAYLTTLCCWTWSQPFSQKLLVLFIVPNHKQTRPIG